MTAAVLKNSVAMVKTDKGESMQKNEVYEVEITGMTDEGDGVGRVNSMAVFIPYTLPGERVRIIIVKVLKHYAFGKLLEVLKPSLHRVKAECPYFYQCGGCQLWHMDLEAELNYKRQKVQDCLTRIAGLDIEVEPTLAPGERLRYRNKAQFPVTSAGIGLFRRNSHTVIPVEDCLIQGKWNMEIISVVQGWMKKYEIPPYDEERDSGFLRNIYTREGESGILVTLVTRERKFPHPDALVQELRALEIPIVGILQNINLKKTNVVLGTEMRILWGEKELTDRIGHVKFHISPLSFYQVNAEGTLCLYETVREFAGLSGKEVLWDLYCGIGTIGLFLASEVKRLAGIEIVPEAVENARTNARLNGIENAEYYCGKAEKLAPSLMREGGRPDVVILDPPRKGCDAALLDTVLKAAPRRIVYVSCKPSTLARDLKILAAGGYGVRRAIPVNMFPCSAHVETVVKLVRKTPDAYIDITVDMDELDLTTSEAKVTYQKIKDYIEEKYDVKVSSLYIAQVKQKYGIIERKNYNTAKSKNVRQPQCPPEKEKLIEEAMRHFKMIS